MAILSHRRAPRQGADEITSISGPAVNQAPAADRRAPSTPTARTPPCATIFGVTDPPLSVTLSDGCLVTIRAIAAGDKDLLRTGFARLSAESRYRRFHSRDAQLGAEDLALLTEVDHNRHDAVIALAPAVGGALGVARYVRVPGEREVAEVAVAVVDDLQGRGLGTALLRVLTDRAREQGIRRYRAVVAADHHRMIELLEHLGASPRESVDPGVVEFDIELPTTGLGEKLTAALRAAGSRQLVPEALISLGRLAQRLSRVRD